MKRSIEVSNLSKEFASLQVLENINLTVNEGEVVSIIGPSGSGKTTLLRCITGLERFNSGEITINGVSHEEYLCSHRIAFVTQKYSNFPWLTVKQNIQLGFRNQKMSAHEIEIKVSKLIADLELDGFENYYLDQLSGGMQQRLAIGRALAQDTDILAMDEPFGALDYQTRESLQQLIKMLNAEFRKTILFVTHDIEEAINISDRIIIISKLPAVIVKEHKIPKGIKNNQAEEVRFEKEFIELRKSIEEDLKSFVNLKSVKSALLNKNWDNLSSIDLFNHFALNDIRKTFQIEFDHYQKKAIIDNLISTENWNLISLGAMLLRNVEVESQLIDKLWDKFQTTDNYELKYFLLHELANRRLPKEKRYELYVFTMSNLEKYRALEHDYLTARGRFEDEIILRSLGSRLSETSKYFQSKEKRWLLIISLLSSPDKGKVKELIIQYTSDKDEFVSKVAHDLLDRIN